jgi:DNA-binding transcriptional ArsR family regulator
MRLFRNTSGCGGIDLGENQNLDQRLALLLHPVRLRLVHAMRTGGSLTTRELGARLPELPKATIYRQVERLARGGVLEVESERRVRGAVERRYRLVREAAAVSADDARSMTLEDHRRVFPGAMAALMADFDAYLDRPGADPFADQVSYRQYIVWLSPVERARFISELGRLLRTLTPNEANDDRAPYVMSTLFFPATRGPPGQDAPR